MNAEMEWRNKTLETQLRRIPKGVGINAASIILVRVALPLKFEGERPGYSPCKAQFLASISADLKMTISPVPDKAIWMIHLDRAGE